MDRERNLLFAIAAALVLFAGVNLLASGLLAGKRLDLTEEGRFTLSEATVRLLEGLEEDIQLELFVSKKAMRNEPQLAEHAARCQELLGEYVTRSRGMLTLSVLDPEPYSEVEDEAVRRGLKGYADARGEPNLYLGLVAKNSVDGIEVMPFLHPAEAPYLEYELSRRIQKLATSGDRPKLGLLTALPMQGKAPANPFGRPRPGEQPFAIYEVLGQSYEVETLDANGLTAVPEHLETLLVAHPRGFPETALYALDQFVLRGGRLFAFVDPWCEADEGAVAPDDPFGGMMAERGSDLGPLLGAYGVALRKDAIAADPALALQARYMGESGREEVGPYLPWIAAQGPAFAEGELIARRLGLVRFSSAGVIDTLSERTTEVTPLVRTTESGATLPLSDLRFRTSPGKLVANFPKQGSPLTLAARISGPAKTAFPEGPGGNGVGEGHLAESSQPIQVILVADADVLSDDLWVQRTNFLGTEMVQPVADNGALVMNGVDLLAGSGGLVELRGRGRTERPFEVVRELQRRSDAQFRAEEQRLLEEERQFRQRIEDLVRQGGADDRGFVVLPPELEAELASLRTQEEETRKKLREVRLNLNREVDGLGTTLKWLHLGALPGAVALVALLTALSRGRRRPVRAPAPRPSPSLQTQGVPS